MRESIAGFIVVLKHLQRAGIDIDAAFEETKRLAGELE
jgi:hypothetical protein